MPTSARDFWCSDSSVKVSRSMQTRAHAALHDRAGSARRPGRSPRPSVRRGAAIVMLLVSLFPLTPSEAAPPDAETAGPSYTLTAWTGHQDLPLGDVFAIAEDRDGYLWLGTSNGLVRFDGAVFTRRVTGTLTQAIEGPVSALLG